MMQSMVLILEKITSKDKDFRYMATSDLLNELQRDTFRVDADTERKLCQAVVAQLDDASGDISSLAVKCIGLLVRKVADQRADELVKSLCDKAVTVVGKKDKEASRDIASIAVKTVVAELPPGHVANTAAQTITTKMLEGLSKDNHDVVNDALDIMAETIAKFGAALHAEHARVRAALLPLLDDSRTLVRKRALNCIAVLSVYLSDDLLQGVVDVLLQRLKAGSLKPDLARSYMQAIAQISRTVGYRFGRYLPEAVPLVVKYCEAATESEDELREFCLQALESFMLHAPDDARAHLDALLPVCLKYLKYDPNFADDSMEDDGAEEEEEQEEEEEDGDDEGYSDDEDMSWKVRRAAAKAVTALVGASSDDALPGLYASAAGELVSRFKEREENVRGDVCNAYIALAKRVGDLSKRYAEGDPDNPAARLKSDVPAVVRAAARQLKSGSIKARSNVLVLLRELLEVTPAPVAEQLPALVPGIVAALADKSSAASGLKIEALLLARAALGAQGPQASAQITPQVKQLTTAVLACASDRYFKVAAEALRVLEAVVVVVRPEEACAAGTAPPKDLAALLPKVFSTLHQRLAAQDQDQEVKEAAISAAATTAARCADLLGAELQTVLRVLLDRLRNEITRLPAVRAFTTLAASPLKKKGALDLDAAGVLEPALAELTTFLRKALRPLRFSALVALEALASKYGPNLPAGSQAQVAQIVEEAGGLLVNDADLPLAGQALHVVAVLLRVQPGPAGPPAVTKALPAALALLRSPLLQGASLEQLQSFLVALANSGAPNANVDALLAALLDAGRSAGAAARSAQLAVAQCVAVLASCAGQAKVCETAGALVRDVDASSAKGGVSGQRLALLCLGELGRRVDLSSMPQVEASISRSLSADSEELKGAASVALGGIACGNLPRYLPSLISQIQAVAAAPKQQYLLLTALNEVLSTLVLPPAATHTQAVAAAAPQAPQLPEGDLPQVLSLLLSSVEGAQEECKLVVAECLGRLAMLHPQKVLAELQKRASDPSPNMRAVVVASVKHMVVERPHPVDAALAAGPLLPLLQAGLNDSDRNVRRAAVISLSAIAHQKPVLVAAGAGGAPPPLSVLLPAVYAQTEMREEYIRTVDLGPFKHKIDDGLELRKSAFECLDILLDSPSCRGLLDTATFITNLKSGLGDHVDVKAPCHLMLAKLCGVAPGAVLAGAEQLVAPLEATLTTRIRGDPVKQELDRHEELVRGCLRAVDAVACLPGVEACGPFQAFMRKVVLVAPLKEKYMQVERERLDAAAGGEQ